MHENEQKRIQEMINIGRENLLNAAILLNCDGAYRDIKGLATILQTKLDYMED